MIDYIDSCFPLIKFPNDDFVEYQRNNFFNIDKLFVFNDILKFERMKKIKINHSFDVLFSNYSIWSRNIQSMRYDFEIALMFMLYYFNKGIPECNNDIDDLYSKYDWSNSDINVDDNNPSNMEQYKKLFNTFADYFVHSLITFVNNIKNEIVYIFNFKSDEIFKFEYKLSKKDLRVFSKNIENDLVTFINNYKNFLYISKFKNVRKFRNVMVHKNTPFIFKLDTKIFKPDNFYAITSITKEESSTLLIKNIQESLNLLSEQCKEFNRIVNKYFKLLVN